MIPIRNIYAMLAFSWRRDTELFNGERLGACDFERHLDVAARLMDAALVRLFRRGLELGYVSVEDASAQPRGALDLSRTVRELLAFRGQLAFKVDDLTEDTPANRVIKAALALLLRADDVDDHVRRRLRRHFARLAGVSPLSPHDALRTDAEPPRHERTYVELLWLARLTLSAMLPDEGAVGAGTTRALRLEERLPLLFQGFIHGAAAHFLIGRAKVSAPILNWAVEGVSELGRTLIPQMRTDVCVSWLAGGRSVIECKFYEAPLALAAFGTSKRFRIEHLYQVVSYANAMGRSGDTPSIAIVYASPDGERLDEKLVLEGVDLRIVWIDLAAGWPELRRQVVDVVSWNTRDAVPAMLGGGSLRARTKDLTS